MTWASALAAYNPIAPNMLLYWAFMEPAIAQGVTLFNFGRCTPGGGTHRFKRHWGPRLWRRLPLALATAVGPRITRYIPRGCA